MRHKDSSKKLIKKHRLRGSIPNLSVSNIDPSFGNYRNSVIGISSIEEFFPVGKTMAPNSNICTNPSEKISPVTIDTKKTPLKNTLIKKVTPGAYHLAGNPGLRGSPIGLRRRSHLPVTTSSLPVSNMNIPFRNFRESVLSIRDEIKIDPPAPVSMIDLPSVEDLRSIEEQTIRERKDSDLPMINMKTPMSP
jgi:hypothetical protein